MEPWDDPAKRTLYHVQLETRDRIVRYEIGTPIDLVLPETD